MGIEADREYSLAEVAVILGVNVVTLRRWIQAGKLAARRRIIQGTYIVKGSDVLARLSELEAEHGM